MPRATLRGREVYVVPATHVSGAPAQQDRCLLCHAARSMPTLNAAVQQPLALVHVRRRRQVLVGSFVVVKGLDRVRVMRQFGLSSKKRLVPVALLADLRKKNTKKIYHGHRV